MAILPNAIPQAYQEYELAFAKSHEPWVKATALQLAALSLHQEALDVAEHLRGLPRRARRQEGAEWLVHRLLSTHRAAGIVPLPGSASPIASPRQFIELAVNIPAQLPHVGQAFSARCLSSPSDIFPTLFLPTPSKTEMRSELSRPASIGPPLT